MVKLSGGPIIVEGRCFWAEVQSRELSADVQPQEKMRLYMVAFHCEKTDKGPERSVIAAINPISVLALHLQASDEVLVQYSLGEPDRNGQGHTLSEAEIRRIEPLLAGMVRQALHYAGITPMTCQISSQCTARN
jgi:hypothetical protein